MDFTSSRVARRIMTTLLQGLGNSRGKSPAVARTNHVLYGPVLPKILGNIIAKGRVVSIAMIKTGDQCGAW